MTKNKPRNLTEDEKIAEENINILGEACKQGKYEIPLSKCCKANVKVGGDGQTHYYICKKCRRPCDVR